MITRLEIDGFKSLRDFAIDLEPFTVLIGPNSAGKSNVLDAIGLLSRLASKPIDEAFMQGRGRSFDQFTRHGGESGRVIRFAVELLVRGLRPGLHERKPSTRFRYELTIERRTRPSGAERLAVRHELLRPLREEEDAWIRAHAELASDASYPEVEETIFVLLGEESGKRRVVRRPEHWREEFLHAPTHTSLASFVSGVDHVDDELIQCRLLQLDAARLREPSERVNASALAADASNLPTILADLPAATLGGIRADLVSIVPGLSSFDVVPEDNTFRIDFEFSDGERLPARLVSDGTLRILALLTTLWARPRPSLVAIEEPENGIYPGRLRVLLDLLRAATERWDRDPADEEQLDDTEGERATRLLPSQLILTSHSPVVLGALRSRTEHLRFVDVVRRDGQRLTRVRTVGRSTAPDRGRLTVSPREIDQLLGVVHGEDAE